MARHVYVYRDTGYEGELELFRRAHVSAKNADNAADLVGAKPAFLYQVSDAADQILTNDEVAVHRFLSSHPDAQVSIVPMAR